jgi:hypothetical protein
MVTDNAASGAQCYLVAGGFLCAADGLSATDLDDVLDSLLLAHLASDREASRTTAFSDWGAAFRAVLTSIGWTLGAVDTATASPASHRHFWGRDSFVPLDLIATELAKALAAGQVDAVRSAITAIPDAGGPVAQRWRETTLATDRAGSLICYAGRAGGSLQLLHNHNLLCATEVVSGYPWAPCPGAGAQLEQSQVEATLNDAVFAQMRGDLRKKVAAFRAADVLSVPVRQLTSGRHDHG